ncbi:hypothetical protein M2454_002561 [Aequitasia blattaphilus]|uniref:ATP-binding protein n=1 Tax=Aequitasia blattaphilus TaxID=2949332 RepID=A0ABT1EC25_9FIRM|nr:ATP-binding protein [Aequitasia blattaphilus]MCP1103226.1 ATP-binding protein [Aequitasia blattaphilus]MCR8615866.1 ATP-binding protein [Aequitasia blattaphilus]
MSMGQGVNPPGFYYSIAYWLICFIYISSYKRRLEGVKLFLAHICFFAAIFVFMTITDGINALLFIPCMIVTFCILLGYIYICCEFSFLEVVYYCSRAFITGEFAGSLAWQLCYYAWPRLQISSKEIFGVAILIIIYPILFGVFLIMERSFVKKNEMRVSKRETIVVLCIMAAAFAISNISYISPNTPFSTNYAEELFIIHTFADLCGLAILYAYHFQNQELQRIFDVNTLQNIVDAQYRNYQMAQESIDIINQKYHDLKHQIGILKMEAKNGKSIQYLEQMEKEIKSYEAQNKTGNHVVDTVLTSKSLYCQTRGITLTCVAEGSVLNFMDDMDVSALFGNLLDNAIESVEKEQDREKRLIHLSVLQQKDFLRIRAENYCKEEIRFKNGIPVTTKSDRTTHGFGMKSMQSTVQKYGGSLQATWKDSWFEVRILIPISKNEIL